MRVAAALSAVLFTLLACAQANARKPMPNQDRLDRSLSPYFLVQGDKGAADGLPLKSTRADVKVSGPIAHVKVTQVYENKGDETIEAIYVFPGSTRAAVFGMKMTIADRTIVAEIQKKEEARKMYEAAKAAGKSASLLEQKRPNVFQMNVANIMPGDVIKVEMDYTELLIPTDGAYELVYPAVVGPRFTGESTAEDIDPSAAKQPESNFWTGTPYKKEGEGAPYAWDVAVDLNAGVPIRNVASSSHSLQTDYSNGKTSAAVTIKDKGDAGTKDFVLKFKLAGDAVQSGVLLFEGSGTGKDKENFFLAMVQPPERVKKRDIPKREYIFILDVSGSMGGYPLETAKTTLRGLLKGMNSQDRFNIMTFSGGAKVLFPESQAVNARNVDKAEELLRSLRGGGGTRILNALEQALAMKTPREYSRTFVAVTDGYVSVEAKVFELIRNNLGQANFFAFGIGNSVNRHIIEGMARAGMGEPFIVMHGDDAAENAGKLEKYLDSPALTGIDVTFDGFEAYDVEPKSVPDLFASRPVLVFGKYKGEAKGSIKVSGIGGAGNYTKTLSVSDYKPSADNGALKYLWARHKVAELADMVRLRKNDARIEQVTQLGLDYNLMTNYTSFIAVDSLVRNKAGSSKTVKQPLPLPKGVGNGAVPSGTSSSTYAFQGSTVGGSLGSRGYGSGGGGRAKFKRTRRKMRPSKSRDFARPPMPAPVAAAESKAEDDAQAVTKKSPTVAVTVDSADAGVDRSKLRAALKRYVRKFLTCAGLKRGTVKLNVTVDSAGNITAVSIASDAVGGTVAGCVRRQLLRLRLGADITASTANAVVTFKF